MSNDWWSMPGPCEFVERIARDLRSGFSVVVWLPQWSPSDFRPSLRRLATQYPVERMWEPADISFVDDDEPVEWLWRQYDDIEDYPFLRTATSLLNPEQHERVLPKGYMIELPACSPNGLPKWTKFLEEYQQAAQQDSFAERTGFLLVVEGFCSSIKDLQAGPLLKIHSYNAQQSHLDMMLYLSGWIGQINRPAKLLERQLAIQTAAVLFPFDPDYATQLVDQLVTNGFDQKAIEKQITEWQRERGWQFVSEENLSHLEISWTSGRIARIEGQLYSHICAPNECALSERVRQAILYAQIQVLLPWIEQMRWRLIDRSEIKPFLKQKLPRNFNYTDGTTQKRVENVYQLEFTHILELANYDPPYLLRPGLTLWKQISLLRACRNDLSHVEPLPPDKLYQLIEITI
jgi:hypothetical protein